MGRVSVWLWVLFAFLLYLTYRIFEPFLGSLAWASVLAISAYPVQRWLERRVRRPTLAALATVMLLTVILVLPTLLVMASFVSEGVDALTSFQQQLREGRLPGLDWVRQNLPVDRATEWLQTRARVDAEELQNLGVKQLERLAQFIVGKAATLARNLVVFVLELLVTLFATFYLLRDGPRAVERLRGVLPLNPPQRERLLHTARDVLYASIYCSFLIALLQGFLGGVLFWILGIRSPVFWGVVMGFFSLLPLVGAWVVWLPAAVFLLLEGEVARALILLGVGALVIGLVDNLLRPWLISGRVRLNGLLVFISVLGGVAAFGFVGLILGPMIVAIGVAILDAYTAPEVQTASSP